jgi:hypothetical protein
MHSPLKETERTTQPSIVSTPQGGQMTREIFGGGDVLFRLSSDDAVKQIQENDNLLLHHTIQNKKDFNRDLEVKIVGTLFLGVVIAVMFVGGLVALFRIDRETLLNIILFVALPSLLYVVIQQIRTHLAENPNYGWESHKSINFAEGCVRISSALFGKQPDSRITLIPFEELGIVCYVNNYWEQGPSIDLFLAKKTDIRESKYIASCAYICNLWSGEPEVAGVPPNTYKLTEQIPREVLNVAQALIARSGIEFFDYVTADQSHTSKNDHTSKKDRRKAKAMTKAASMELRRS